MHRAQHSLRFDLIPKLELHLHLEGSIPPAIILELINKYDHTLAKTLTIESLTKIFQFNDFTHFLELWAWKNTFIRETDDFTLIANSVAKHLRSQNIHYAEIFYSPADFAKTGIPLQDMTEAIYRGYSKVDGIKIQLIADLVRGSDPKQTYSMLDPLLELQHEGVIGIGLGGNEAKFPPGVYKATFQRARDMGLLTTVHAGEGAGPASIWEALRELHPHRIGHGVRAVEDPLLMTHLAEHQIPLEGCPLSNICTDIYSDYAQHPVRRIFDSGIPISINTDDPAMFQNSMAEEYAGLMDIHRFSALEIQQLTLTAVEHSFADEATKSALRTSIIQDPQWTSHFIA